MVLSKYQNPDEMFWEDIADIIQSLERKVHKMKPQKKTQMESVLERMTDLSSKKVTPSDKNSKQSWIDVMESLKKLGMSDYVEILHNALQLHQLHDDAYAELYQDSLCARCGHSIQAVRHR